MTVLEHFQTTVHYDAPPAAVYAALARPDRWWTTDGDAVGTAGDLLRLTWSASDFVAFRVDVADAPRAMRWTCVAQRDGNLPRPDEWVGTTLVFDVRPSGAGSELRFEHLGLDPSLECFDVCAGGWDVFLRQSVRRLIATGEGTPYVATSARGLARAYHAAWTRGDYAAARALLADDLRVEVPINAYADADAFIAAVEGFGGLASSVEPLEGALIAYDMQVAGLGAFRVAEQVEVAGGRITALRQIHDTHALRQAAPV